MVFTYENKDYSLDIINYVKNIIHNNKFTMTEKIDITNEILTDDDNINKKLKNNNNINDTKNENENENNNHNEK